MTPTDKAYELVNEFRSIIEDDQRIMKFDHAKTCAMVCVKNLLRVDNDKGIISYLDDSREIIWTTYYSYWAEVLIEISKL